MFLHFTPIKNEMDVYLHNSGLTTKKNENNIMHIHADHE